MDDVTQVTIKQPTPWTLKAFDWAPGSPTSTSVVLLVIVVGGFLVTRSFSNAEIESNDLDFRMAIFHIFYAVATAFFYVHLIKSMDRTEQRLMPLIDLTPEQLARFTRNNRLVNWSPLIGGLMLTSVAIVATKLSSDFANPWDWHQNSHDTLWIRLAALCFSCIGGAFLALLITGSLRLSRMSEAARELDLFDLQVFEVLIRQGLTNCFLLLTLTSLLIVFMLEPKLEWIMLQLVLVFAASGLAVLILPLQGIRRQIRTAKKRELKWCRDAYMTTRDHLKKGTPGEHSIAEIRAYRAEIEDISGWPFDNRTVTRFSLYLLIPIGSIVGGAFVERGIDVLLG